LNTSPYTKKEKKRQGKFGPDASSLGNIITTETTVRIVRFK